MKPVTLAISIAVLALPLLAADLPPKNTTVTTLTAPASPQQVDSPLVRAAKASGRLNKKPSIVITNETLTRTGGNFAAMDVTTSESGINHPDAETKAKSQRDTAAATVQRLKNSSADYYRSFGEPSKPALPQAQRPPTEGQRMSTTQLGTMSTTELGHTSTTQLGQMSTTQASTTSTTQPSRTSTTQPQVAPAYRPQP